MAREDLSPVEEARACAALTEELGLTREEVGLRVGRSRVAVSNLIRLLELPDETLELLDRRELSEGHGRALLLAEDHGDRRRLARRRSAGWSVRELEARAGGPATAGDRRSRAGGRAPGAPPRPGGGGPAISDLLGAALGQDMEVAVTVDGGYRAHLSFESIEEALALAETAEPFRYPRGRVAAGRDRRRALESCQPGRLAQSVRALL